MSDFKKGDFVRFINTNGYPGECRLAAKELSQTGRYKVRQVEESSWYTALYLDGAMSPHNSVMFEKVT